MSEIDTNEYIKKLHERLNKLQNNNSENIDNNNNNDDLGKTQIIPKIQDISEYKDNSIEVERWREKKYGTPSSKSNINLKNDIPNNDSINQQNKRPSMFDMLKEENQKSSVLVEEKVNKPLEEQNYKSTSENELDKEELLAREREQIYNNYEEEEFEDNYKLNESNRNGKHIEPGKPKKKWKKVLKVLFIIAFVLSWLVAIGLFIFFKTGLLQYHKELWVQTAMTTMNHQYLATWFMSADEINAIMKEMEVENNEDSILHEVELPAKTDNNPKENVIKVDKISGDTYVGFVMTISDPSKLKLVDARKKSTGTQLSEICKKNNAIAGINASGFEDPDGNGDGNKLNEPCIIDKELLYGEKGVVYSWIGLTEEGELVLGKYTYEEAIDIGIVSGLQFGPYIIVNGHNQITKSNAGGLHPRMAIGQKKDGTIIFVCIDGRQPGYSLGATQLELQNIFERYGAYNAANLDGGSSATMVYDGKRVNKTSTPMGERYLPNAFIVEK